MRANGARTVLVSGGFTFFTSAIAERAGFDIDYGNRFIIENGAHHRRRRSDPRPERQARRHGAGSASMPASASRKSSPSATAPTTSPCSRRPGLGVAFRAKPIVAAEAAARINHGDLTALLYPAGLPGGRLRFACIRGTLREDLHDRCGLCRPRLGGLLCRIRLDGELRRQGRGQDRARCSQGEIPIYEPGLDELLERNAEAGPHPFLHRSRRSGARGRTRVPRRRHADAPRRRLCRSHLCLRGGGGNGAASERLHGHRHQIHRAGRHQPRDRAAAARAPARCRFRRLLQSGIPARRLRHPRLHPSRSRADRLRRRARRAR